MSRSLGRLVKSEALAATIAPTFLPEPTSVKRIMPPTSPPTKLVRDNAQVLVIDVQERLLPHIAGGSAVVREIVRLLRAADVLELPVTLVEQYTAGLGKTVAEIDAAASRAARFEKMTFSACGDAAALEHVLSANRGSVLVVGIETHVCVLKTALDLFEHRFSVFVAADGVGSRHETDHQVALQRMRRTGATITTVESAIFEMLDECGTDLFRSILPIVK